MALYKPSELSNFDSFFKEVKAKEQEHVVQLDPKLLKQNSKEYLESVNADF